MTKLNIIDIYPVLNWSFSSFVFLKSRKSNDNALSQSYNLLTRNPWHGTMHLNSSPGGCRRHLVGIWESGVVTLCLSVLVPRALQPCTPF